MIHSFCAMHEVPPSTKPELHYVPSLPAVCSLKLETWLSSCWISLSPPVLLKMFANWRCSSFIYSSGQDALLLQPAFLQSCRSHSFSSQAFSDSHLPQAAVMVCTSFQEWSLWNYHTLFFCCIFQTCTYLLIYASYPKVASWPGISDFVFLEEMGRVGDIRVKGICSSPCPLYTSWVFLWFYLMSLSLCLGW